MYNLFLIMFMSMVGFFRIFISIFRFKILEETKIYFYSWMIVMIVVVIVMEVWILNSFGLDTISKFRINVEF